MVDLLQKYGSGLVFELALRIPFAMFICGNNDIDIYLKSRGTVLPA